eukprot:TRINITY_DN562_c0_g1_i5.p1 TRINITY_DN562_c0_g1~~TRINITY_DN562_c0_g1_i5.p1  ORF type:complete len:756 (-),score=207.54 TRINITY_DN562_c0_g1_i5:222-2489(-)
MEKDIMASADDVENNQSRANEESSVLAEARNGTSMWMVLTLAYECVGVVYGDIGTSPLYMYATIFSEGLSDVRDLMGALSLIIWTLTLSPLVKYMFFVMYCDDNGEGGTFALYSLLCRHVVMSELRRKGSDVSGSSKNLLEEEAPPPPSAPPTISKRFAMKLTEKLETKPWLQRTVLATVLLATSMLIADGVLTPAQSVLSAAIGIQVQFHQLTQESVVIISCAILGLLFLGQQFGTAKVALVFAPIMVAFMAMIGILGIYQLFESGSWFVLKAISPTYAIDFLSRNGMKGWLMLGSVSLCITGAEAMFADLGHFTRLSIQIAFGAFMFPCLMLAYIGQAAWLTQHMDEVAYTFFKSIPSSFFWPGLVISTLAAIVASQTIISATFSIVNQSMALGCFPRVKVLHMSQTVMGQIYIPEVNVVLAVLTILVTALMGSHGTTTIGNAYGLTVTMVFLITTILVTVIHICVKEMGIATWLPFLVIFLVIEGAFVSANLYKFVHGGWVPVAFAAAFMTIMSVWRYGEEKKQRCNQSKKLSVEWALSLVRHNHVARVPGLGIVYSEISSGIPVVYSQFLKRIPAIHEVLVFLCVKDVEIPSVSREERFRVYRLGPREAHMFRCIARYGYKDVNRQGVAELPELAIEALVNYVRAEEQSVWTNGSMRESRQHVNEMAPECSSSDGISSVRAREIQFIMESKAAGVTSIIGRTDLRAKEGNLAKKILIDYIYCFLKANSRESAVVHNIPPDDMLEVGTTFNA